uniref:RRM domain-containing protein n=1 Tax=Amphimedon queenslandica TaxID=400682 RepID=A0A1X7VXQ9_AMPQE
MDKRLMGDILGLIWPHLLMTLTVLCFEFDSSRLKFEKCSHTSLMTSYNDIRRSMVSEGRETQDLRSCNGIGRLRTCESFILIPHSYKKSCHHCGLIDGIRIIKDTRTDINKRFAYAIFKDSSSVLFACKKNERLELEGRKLRVFCCRSNKSKFQTKFGGAKSQVGRNKKLLKSFQPSKKKGKTDKRRLN